MKRRTYLTATGIAATTLAGCSGNSGPNPKFGTVADEGANLVATVEDAQHADRVVFDVEDGENTEVSVSEDDPRAEYALGDPATLGTKQQRLQHETGIQIRLYDQGGSQVELKEWDFRPELKLTDVVHSSEFGYTPENHTEETTPILEISNTGSGPTRIGELVVFNISQDVPLRGSNNDTGFAKAVIARNSTDGRLHPVETQEDNPFLISGSESAYFAANGLFTHSGKPPENVESATQKLDVEIRWLFGNLRYTVEAELTGGISQASTGAYQFSEYEIKSIDETSPLR